MTYFLRYTNTANEDLERATSVNASDLDANQISKEDAASMFGCDEDMIDEVDGCWFQILNGICGYELESETLEDAIEEAATEKQFSFVGRPVIFYGKYASDSEYVADGDLFIPISIEIEL
jgi:hypothetical protein